MTLTWTTFADTVSIDALSPRSANGSDASYDVKDRLVVPNCEELAPNCQNGSDIRHRNTRVRLCAGPLKRVCTKVVLRNRQS